MFFARVDLAPQIEEQLPTLEDMGLRQLYRPDSGPCVSLKILRFLKTGL
jgi:hypothetical protein